LTLSSQIERKNSNATRQQNDNNNNGFITNPYGPWYSWGGWPLMVEGQRCQVASITLMFSKVTWHLNGTPLSKRQRATVTATSRRQWKRQATASN
jgi:hypothetical protein